MMPLAEIGSAIQSMSAKPDAAESANKLLKLSEAVVEHWIVARGEQPTDETREGFRLLALHRQGAKGDPSFNACRETCREVVYHYNLITTQAEDSETTNRLDMMRMISNHMFLFISGKMQVAELGEFCCSAKPIRLSPESESRIAKEP